MLWQQQVGTICTSLRDDFSAHLSISMDLNAPNSHSPILHVSRWLATFELLPLRMSGASRDSAERQEVKERSGLRLLVIPIKYP